jgi:hypothetical protein
LEEKSSIDGRREGKGRKVPLAVGVQEFNDQSPDSLILGRRYQHRDGISILVWRKW